MEHRWGKRIAVDIPIKLSARPYSVRAGRLINLSTSGALMDTDFDMRLLSRIQVIIEMPLRFRHATPVISAYVARKFKDGYGLEWCEFAPRPIMELIRSPPVPHLMVKAHAAPELRQHALARERGTDRTFYQGAGDVVRAKDGGARKAVAINHDVV